MASSAPKLAYNVHFSVLQPLVPLPSKQQLPKQQFPHATHFLETHHLGFLAIKLSIQYCSHDVDAMTVPIIARMAKKVNKMKNFIFFSELFLVV
jgi:hypothetical protein